MMHRNIRLPSMLLRKSLFRSFILCFLASLGGDLTVAQNRSSTPSTSGTFDEVFLPNGEVRPVYREIWEVYSRIPERRRNQIRRLSLRDFKGDNALLPLPRVLSDHEYNQVIRPGVKQRAAAIRAFWRDLTSGRRNFVRDGIVPESVIDRLVLRYHGEEWIKDLRGHELSTWYGPDLIRDANGNFRVVEDNLGYVGGFGDLHIARESLLTHVPEYADVVQSPDPHRFYKNLMDRYKKRNKIPESLTVLLQYVGNQSADKEPNRLKDLFAKEGVVHVRLNNSNTSDQRLKNRLFTTKDGVFFEGTLPDGSKGIQRVGYVIADMETADISSGHPAYKNKSVMDAALTHLNEDWSDSSLKNQLQLLVTPDPQTGKIDVAAVERFLRKKSEFSHGLNKKFGIAKFWDRVLEGKVGVSATPIIDEIVGDKEFNMYMDKLVKYYTGKNPIITGIPTRSFRYFDKNGRAQFDRQVSNEVFGNIDHFVIKRVDGRGGDAVWVGPKMNKSFLPKLKAMVEAEPGSFIVQDFLWLSELDGHIADLRVLSEIGPRNVFTGEVPWGRAISLKGDGRVNLGANGSETTVFVMKPKTSCSQNLKSIISAR